jgi:hypothetical protein
MTNIAFLSYTSTFELAASKDVLEKWEFSLLLAFGKSDNNEDGCGNEYTRFIVDKEDKNSKEKLPHGWMLPMQPAAFGNEIIEQVNISFIITILFTD